MKTTPVFISACLFVFFSCQDRTQTEVKDILPQFEITDKKDTINYVDVNGLKQGRWIVYEVGASNLNASINVTKSAGDTINKTGSWESCSSRRKTEEGFYKDDKKTGCWKRFNNDGSVKDSVVHTL